MARTEITAIGNSGTNTIENKPQSWIDNMMAQRGSVIASNFNSVNNTSTQNKQFNQIMIETGQPHRVGPGNETLESPYTSQLDCPPNTIFTTPDRCIPEETTPQTAGFLSGKLTTILIVGGFLYYAYKKGLLSK